MRLVANFRTPTAALYNLTKDIGPYRWWGFLIGDWFFGVMRCVRRPTRGGGMTPEQELDELARKAVLVLHRNTRHGGKCKCGPCVAIGVLYGYHCIPATEETERP